MSIFRLLVVVVIGVSLAACIHDDFERSDIIYDRPGDDGEESSDEKQEESTSPDGDQAVGGEEKAEEDQDLQCADDQDICRFCGPPEEVVEECPDGDDSFACQVFELVNDIRNDHGLDELEYDATLAQSAMIHAMDQSKCDYFAHDSLDGTTFFERCEENGYEGTCTGENIGGGQRTPEDVVDAWMESPGHRDNILYEHHSQLGVAYYEGEGTFSRYWMKHFGRDD